MAHSEQHSGDENDDTREKSPTESASDRGRPLTKLKISVLRVCTRLAAGFC